MRRRARQTLVAAGIAVLGSVSWFASVAAGGPSIPPRWRIVLSAPLRHVRAGGIDFAYRAIGSGRPLLLIEGLQSTMTDQWDPAVLARVAAHHRMIMFDNRGVGLSGGDVANLRVAQMADDAANLLAALHIHKPDVWGQSLGGYIAEELAIRHPTAVRRLVLTSSSAGSRHWVAPAVQLPPVGDNAAILRVIFTPDAAGRAAERAFVSRLALWRPQESLSRTVGDAQTVAVARFLANPGEGAWEALPRVHARAFVGAGLRDVVAPPGNGRMLAARLTHATLHLYPAGHAFYVQDAGRFVPDLLHFLAAG